MTCDTNFSDVVLLLHNDGTNGSTTVVDSSSVGNIATVGGIAALDTSQAKFGPSSLHLPGGNADFISYTVNSGDPLDILPPSSGDFTIEGWFFFTSGVAFTPGQELIEFATSGSVDVFRMDITPSFGAHGIFQLNTNITGWGNLGGNLPNISNNTWHHWAIVRNGGVGKIYLDGNDQGFGSAAWSTAFTTPAGTTAAVGRQTGFGGSYLESWVDDIRITKGLARYTSNFTPPVAAFGGACGPVINTQPQSQTVPLGSAVTFSVSATSSGGPLTYQWYLNAVLIPGATASSYSIPSVALTDNGDSFTVFVSDNNGSLLSSPAVLTISGAGRITPFSDSVVFPMTFGAKLNFVEYTYYPMRPVLGGEDMALAVPNMIINRYKQQPAETRKRGVDFTLFCEPGEIITGIAAPVVAPVTSPPLVVTNVIVDPATQQKFAYDVSGGVDGTEYNVQFDVTFNTLQNTTEEAIFFIALFSEEQFP